MWANLDAPEPERGARAREPQPDDRRTRTGGPGLHGRVHGTPERLSTTMARHPFHDVAIVRRVQHAAGARARGSRLPLDHVRGRARRARRRRRGDPRHRRRRRRARQRLRVPVAHRPGVAVDVAAWASPRCSRPRRAIANGLATIVLIAAGSAGVYTDRASTAPWTRPAQRVRRAVRHVHRRRVRAHRPPPHAPLRHDARALATVAADHPQQRPRATPRPCYHGRGPFTVQDILDSRMVADPFHLLDCAMTSEGGCGAGARPAPTVRRDLPKQPVYVLGGNTDHFGPVVPAPAVVGPRRQRPARSHRRARRPPGRRGRVRRVGPRSRRRRRVRVLRPVLVRDHPPVRGVRLLRGGRGRRLRDGRHHRARRPLPDHHRRRHSCRSATAARSCRCSSGSSAACSSCAASARPCRSTAPRSRCAPTAVPAPCSPTCCCSGRSAP